jgi:hypothetical protein
MHDPAVLVAAAIRRLRPLAALVRAVALNCCFVSWINFKLLRWVKKKYQVGTGQAERRMAHGYARQPRYFAHWIWTPPTGAVTRATRPTPPRRSAVLPR